MIPLLRPGKGQLSRGGAAKVRKDECVLQQAFRAGKTRARFALTSSCSSTSAGTSPAGKAFATHARLRMD